MTNLLRYNFNKIINNIDANADTIINTKMNTNTHLNSHTHSTLITSNKTQTNKPMNNPINNPITYSLLTISKQTSLAKAALPAALARITTGKLSALAAIVLVGITTLILTLSLTLTLTPRQSNAAEHHTPTLPETPYTEPQTPHPTLMEMGVPETPQHPILHTHDPHATQAYDITPYIGMTDEGLFELLRQEEEFYVRLQPGMISCEIDDHWKTACDIFQALIQKRPHDHSYEGYYGYIDGAFTGIKADIRGLITVGYSGFPISDHLSLGSLCYAWKQAAWVDPNETDEFIRLLETGFEGPIRSDGQRDLIPQRPEWIPYWRQRATLLRTQPHWHIPESETDPIVKQKVRQRFEEYCDKLDAQRKRDCDAR